MKRKLLFAIFLAGISISYQFPKSSDTEPKINFYTIDNTWDGKPVSENESLTISLQAVPDSPDIIFGIDAPYHNDPPPDGETGQPLLGLWNYEVAQIYFLNDQEQYLEVEISPHGQHIVLLLNGHRNTIRHSLPLEVTTRIEGSRWSGKATIKGDYFPPQVTRMNAYAIHGLQKNRRYLALYPTDGSTKEPDVHNLSFFQRLRITQINPMHQNYNELSDLWKDAIQGIFKYKISRQWNNFRSKIPPTTASLQGFQGGVEINFTMPLNDENYPAESFVAIFENAQKESIKIQLFVDGHYFVEFFNNRRNKLNQENFSLDYRVEDRVPRYVKGSIMVPPSFFPPNVNLLNMYALFGVETMLAMTLRAMEIRPGIDFRPNLNNIEHFISVDFDLLVSSNDEYSDVWRRLLKLPLPENDSRDSISEEAQKEITSADEEILEEDQTEKPKEDQGGKSPEVDSDLFQSEKIPDARPKETVSELKDSNPEDIAPTTEVSVTNSQVEDVMKESGDAMFPLTSILMGDSGIYEKDEITTALTFAKSDEVKKQPKDQLHFNKPLRFLLKKPRNPTPDEKEEEYNPLRGLQGQDSPKEEEVQSELLTQHPSLEKEIQGEIPTQEPLIEKMQKEIQEQSKESDLLENKEQGLTTVKIEDEHTTERQFFREDEGQKISTELIYGEQGSVAEPINEEQGHSTDPVDEEHRTSTEPVDEDLGPSTEKGEQNYSTNEGENKFFITEQETSKANQEQPDEKSEVDTLIEREKHQRRYDESSNQNEVPITFKITFDSKTQFESGKQEPELRENLPEEDLGEEYPLLDEIPPGIIGDIEALPPPHPICFTEGLVSDHYRCQVFYECVLEDGQWEVYNWRCKRGTYYDPVKVACVKGYC